jgi:hypothetical protein
MTAQDEPVRRPKRMGEERLWLCTRISESLSPTTGERRFMPGKIGFEIRV